MNRSGKQRDKGRTTKVNATTSLRDALPLLLTLIVVASAAQGAGEELECLIQPKESITLSFAIEGVVDEVLVDRGDLIEEGQVLARLRDDVERASLEIAEARAAAKGRIKASDWRLAFAARDYDRHVKLRAENILAEGVVDEARLEQQVAEAALLDAKEARKVARLEAVRAAAVLEMREVKSPVKGVVVERILSPGEWADPPQVLKIAQIDPLRVEVFAPLALLGRVAVGQKARVRPEEPVGGSYEARVTVVDRVIEAASGTFGVRLELANPDYALVAGVRCRIEFEDIEASLPGVSETSLGALSPIPGE
jgi:RND family efflux transporter MFP subunit